MVHHIVENQSAATVFLNELRDAHIQKDALRFRHNLERLSQVLAYEASKQFLYIQKDVETPLGIKKSFFYEDQMVVASVLRAGLPMHYSVLNFFDRAENCFVSAYRKHHKSGDFEIKLEYVASPDLNNKVLILCDPMIATGASIISTLKELKRYGMPKKIIVLGIIGSRQGVDAVQNWDEDIDIYIGDIDEELTARGYIVPGLGDAGDLAFGDKCEASAL